MQSIFCDPEQEIFMLFAIFLSKACFCTPGLHALMPLDLILYNDAKLHFKKFRPLTIIYQNPFAFFIHKLLTLDTTFSIQSMLQ